MSQHNSDTGSGPADTTVDSHRADTTVDGAQANATVGPGPHTGSSVADRRDAGDIDWLAVSRTVIRSRTIDAIEETRLVPERKVTYQFSAGGHEFAQAILATLLTHEHDGVGAYYRSRPLLLGLGASVEDVMSAPLTRSGSYSDGRDIGVVCNYPNPGGPCVLPMSGDVGSQFTPTVGWAQALRYRHMELRDGAYRNAIAVVLGGDGAIATNGFWSALTIATTLRLPVLFFVEDNGYGISVPSNLQTPGGDIAANLTSFHGLRVWAGDGTDPQNTPDLVAKAVRYVRSGNGPALLRLRVPRLCGHSGQDTQAYKSASEIAEEKRRDPLPKLKSFVTRQSIFDWDALVAEVETEVEVALGQALARPDPDPTTATRFVFCEFDEDGEPIRPQRGGVFALSESSAGPQHRSTDAPSPEPQRINMVAAIRRTLESELAADPRMLVFGEDVGPKGGVHAATQGLQERFGKTRVFDTSLSEEGIIGRAVGFALAGLNPVAEIQFRKYADPATEQLFNCGTIRWRTNNRFATPIVVRMPGGFAKIGDPWHSVSNEVMFVHAVGWRVAMPSNAEDAVGLLRTAIRGHDPVIFFEHRQLLDAAGARRGYPGDDYVLPFGRANTLTTGTDLTVVTWGGMVARCLEAAGGGEQGVKNGDGPLAGRIEIIDLRTLSPWDEHTVLESVRRTRRCLVVHEDGLTAGFGAEVVATVSNKLFLELDAPTSRMAVRDVPIPHNRGLMESVLPDVDSIRATMTNLIEF